MMPVTVTAMLAAPATARRGLRAIRRSPNSSGTGSRAEILISAGRRRGARAESASAPTVLVRAARNAGTAVDARATSQRHSNHFTDGGESERWRTRSADQARARAGDQRCCQPPDRQPDRRRGQCEDHVLGQQYGGDKARRAADCLEQPDPPGLLSHPAAGQDGHARYRQQSKQPARRASGPAARPERGGRRRRRCSARRRPGPSRRGDAWCCMR